jgi:hypothetical protein
LTVEERTPPPALVRELVILVRKAGSEVVDMTPLILLVAVVVPMVRMLEDMTLVVATTPLTVVVRVFPVTDCVKEFTSVAMLEATPLTRTLKKLVLEEATAEVMILEVAVMPLTVLVAMFPPVVKVWVVRDVSDVVETTPCALVVSTPPVALVMARFVVVAFVAVRLVKMPVTAERREAMILVAETPCRVEVPETVSAVAEVVASERDCPDRRDRILVVETTPLTVEERMPEPALVRELVILVRKAGSEVVDMTPLILLVAVVVPMVRMLEDMTLVVATTPLTVVVRVLPESEVVREDMIFVKTEEMPLTTVAKVLVVVASVLEEMTEVVAVTPLTVLVAMLLAILRELVVAPGVSVVVLTMPLILVVKRLVEVA